MLPLTIEGLERRGVYRRVRQLIGGQLSNAQAWIDDTHLARPGQGVFSDQAAGEMRYADEQVHAWM